MLKNYKITDGCCGGGRMEETFSVSKPNLHDPYQVSCYISNYLRANITKGHKENIILFSSFIYDFLFCLGSKAMVSTWKARPHIGRKMPDVTDVGPGHVWQKGQNNYV